MTVGERWDAVVVGGGPAGAMIACRLAEAGARILLIERERRPHHKVCGEFLSFEAELHLRELGLDLERMGALPIDAVRLVSGRQVARARLPFRALGLSRFALDERLLSRAAERGVEVRRGLTVRAIAPAGSDGWRIGIGGGGEAVEAPAVFLATGKHDLRGLRRVATDSDAGDLIGFKMHFHLAEPQREALARHVEVVLFEGGYAGLQPVEGASRANLCLLVQRATFDRLGKRWDRLLDDLARRSPHLACRLRGATPCWNRPAAVFSLPYGYVHGNDGGGAARPDGLFRLGDQFAVIPSFCGDGIAIALHTAKLAADGFLESGRRSSAAYHDRARAEIGRQVHRASLLAWPIASPVGQRLTVRACRAFPALLPALALRTRIPSLVPRAAGYRRP